MDKLLYLVKELNNTPEVISKIAKEREQVMTDRITSFITQNSNLQCIPNYKLILNGNDPATALLGENHDADYFIYQHETNPHSTKVSCPICGQLLAYQAEYYDHIGIFSCACGYKSPQATYLADQIDFSQAAVIPKGNDTLLIVGKDGGVGGADTFIGRILKETFPNDKAIVYTDDIAPVKVEGEVIDMTEIGKFLDSEV